MTQVKAAPKKPYKKPKEDHPLVVIVVTLGIIMFSCNNMKQDALNAQVEKCNRSDAWTEKWYDSDCVQNPELESKRLYSGSRLFFNVK